MQLQEFLLPVSKERQSNSKTFYLNKQHFGEYMDLFLHKKTFTSSWTVYNIVCVLSYRQSSGESGFSVKKELLIENISKVSLTSQYQFYDYFQSFGIKGHDYTSPIW